MTFSKITDIQLADYTNSYLGQLQYIQSTLEKNETSTKIIYKKFLQISQSLLISFQHVELEKVKKTYSKETMSLLEGEIWNLKTELTSLRFDENYPQDKSLNFIIHVIKFVDYLEDPSLLKDDSQDTCHLFSCSTRGFSCEIL